MCNTVYIEEMYIFDSVYLCILHTVMRGQATHALGRQQHQLNGSAAATAVVAQRTSLQSHELELYMLSCCTDMTALSISTEALLRVRDTAMYNGYWLGVLHCCMAASVSGCRTVHVASYSTHWHHA
jgi:hypothetical protein